MKFLANWLKSKQSGSDNYRELPVKRMLRYKVKGTNPLTGRRKTVKNIFIASWHQYPTKIPGIDGPYEFILDMPTLSDGQKNFCMAEFGGLIYNFEIITQENIL